MLSDAPVQVRGSRLGAAQDVEIRETTQFAGGKVQRLSSCGVGDGLPPTRVLEVGLVIRPGLDKNPKLLLYET